MNVVEGARFYGLDRGIKITCGRDKNNGRFRRETMCVLQHLDAINLGHFDVGDNHVVTGAFHLPNGQLARVHRFDFVSFLAQCDLEQFTN